MKSIRNNLVYRFRNRAEKMASDALPLFANRYLLGRKLNEGGMGMIYEALDLLAAGQRVALKQVLTPLQGLNYSSTASTLSQAGLQARFESAIFKTLPVDADAPKPLIGGLGVYDITYRPTENPLDTLIPARQNEIPTAPASDDTDSDLISDKANTEDERVVLSKEFQMLASLRHPNIISVLDYGFDEHRQPYFTMELLDQPQTILQAAAGQNLHEKIRLMTQLLQALAYLHRRGVLHRDLKPANVLVKEGEVKLVDFGLAVNYRQQEADDVPVGTVAYMSPELWLGDFFTIASDMYAVGIILYEILVGQHPFLANDPMSYILASINTAPDLSPIDAIPLPHRSSIRLAAIVERLLAKEALERYQDANEVIYDLHLAIGEDAPPESSALRESFLQAAAFVGRQTELAQLSSALDQAMLGRGSSWLVGGESGVGKSRLLDEIRTLALVKGAVVLRGQGEVQGGLPYQLWRDPLSRLLLSTDISDDEAVILKQIIPNIESLLRYPVKDQANLQGVAAYSRMVETVVHIFQKQKQPLVLILEDLHWATRSLEILQELNKQVSELPLLILGSYRDEEMPDLPRVLPGMMVMGLQRLAAESIVELSVSMLGVAGEREEVLELLQRETEGNVFFLIEVVRTLAEEAGSLAAVGSKSLPAHVFAGGIQSVIQRRLSRVPEWGHDWLRLAAILGRELDLDVLNDAIQKRQTAANEHHSLQAWLMLCADAAVLEVRDERWMFAHDQLRLGILNQLQPEQVRSLHQEAAEALEAIHAQTPSYRSILSSFWAIAGNMNKAHQYQTQSDSPVG